MTPRMSSSAGLRQFHRERSIAMFAAVYCWLVSATGSCWSRHAERNQLTGSASEMKANDQNREADDPGTRSLWLSPRSLAAAAGRQGDRPVAGRGMNRSAKSTWLSMLANGSTLNSASYTITGPRRLHARPAASTCRGRRGSRPSSAGSPPGRATRSRISGDEHRRLHDLLRFGGFQRRRPARPRPSPSRDLPARRPAPAACWSTARSTCARRSTAFGQPGRGQGRRHHRPLRARPRQRRRPERARATPGRRAAARSAARRAKNPTLTCTKRAPSPSA